ncbi:UvrD-helicase domain-containing protein [Pseudactinotalea sp. HY158]|uniref:UvrD-helicase domain-containing protein n=1 Tax=Pseudactinotalea sp. HY158 TaxID=2654547 RepID=UPI00129C3A10|nr:AAA family ATPase [Pseudactinotalea sp. HY158]
MVRWNAFELAVALGEHPPTPEQQAVIEAPLEPQLVIAGAGSGKTATMASRVVYLVANGLVAPEQILGLTFTRKAAAELADRVRRRLRSVRDLDPELDLDDQPRISTYNSYAAGIVTDHALRAGIDPDTTLIGEAGTFQLAAEVVQTWAEPLSSGAAPGTLVAAVTALSGELAEHGLTTREATAYLRTLATDLSGKEAAGRQRAPRAEIRHLIASLGERIEILAMVEAYQRLKHERNVVDFGDQVRTAATIAQRVGAVGRAERDHYRVVLLDEYQDTSIAQVQLLRALFSGEVETGRGHPVTAVGDPNQAIYGWRGAAAGTLLDFPRAFPRADGAAADIATLSTAWRNAEAVLAVANKVAAPLRSEEASPALEAVVPAAAPAGRPRRGGPRPLPRDGRRRGRDDHPLPHRPRVGASRRLGPADRGHPVPQARLLPGDHPDPRRRRDPVPGRRPRRAPRHPRGERPVGGPAGRPRSQPRRRAHAAAHRARRRDRRARPHGAVALGAQAGRSSARAHRPGGGRAGEHRRGDRAPAPTRMGLSGRARPLRPRP